MEEGGGGGILVDDDDTRSFPPSGFWPCRNCSEDCTGGNWSREEGSLGGPCWPKNLLPRATAKTKTRRATNVPPATWRASQEPWKVGLFSLLVIKDLRNGAAASSESFPTTVLPGRAVGCNKKKTSFFPTKKTSTTHYASAWAFVWTSNWRDPRIFDNV